MFVSRGALEEGKARQSGKEESGVVSTSVGGQAAQANAWSGWSKVIYWKR